MSEQTRANQNVDAQIHTNPGESTIQRWRRRGVLAAAWAAVLSVVAKQTTQPVFAGTDGDVVLGAANASNAMTTISYTGGAVVKAALVVSNLVHATAGTALWADASEAGVVGHQIGDTATQPVSAGVLGIAESANSPGVMGSHSAGVGVLGASYTGIAVNGVTQTGVGVLGWSNDGIGVHGVSHTVGISGQISSEGVGAPNTIAVSGFNSSPYAGPSAGAGGYGVYGASVHGHGVVGAASTSGAAAVVGATSGAVGAYAGVFFGPVVVEGALTVFGGPKSAAVRHPDGSHRLLYCMESPESWFEDFGESALTCGQADVTLDPDFAAVADTEKYHVFLTQYDEHNDLCVTRRSAHGFLVKAKDAVSNAPFSWRVVAKRKDIEARRFETVTVPPEPTLPTVPETPTPQRPSPRQAGMRGDPLE